MTTTAAPLDLFDPCEVAAGQPGAEPIAWILPGEGESGLQCGAWRTEGVCHSEGLIWRRHYWCRRLECPVCWYDAARAEGARATHRLLTGWRGLKHEGEIRHAVVSWPLDRQPETMNDLNDALALVRLLLVGERWTGYSLVIHPFRGRCSKCRRDLDSEEGCCGRKVYDRPGFHLHVLGVKGWAPQRAENDPEDPWTKAGLVYKNMKLRGKEEDSLETRVRKTYDYELGHAGRPGRGRHSLRWCAAFSYSKLKTQEPEPGGSLPCPSCSGPLDRTGWAVTSGRQSAKEYYAPRMNSYHYRDWPEPDPEPPPRAA